MAIALIVISAVALPANAEWLIGYEGNDRRGLGYLTRLHRRPVRGDQQLVLWGTASYRWYEVRETAGTTRVTSPGLGAGIIYKWFFPSLELGLGPGYEIRWTRQELENGGDFDETQQGVFVQGDLHYFISDATRLTLLGSYSDADEWLYGNAHLLYRISDRLRAGPETGFQGNDDVDVRFYGGIAEVPFQERTALQFHAGQSRTRYRGGIEETQPYYSVGIVRSFR